MKVEERATKDKETKKATIDNNDDKLRFMFV